MSEDRRDGEGEGEQAGAQGAAPQEAQGKKGKGDDGKPRSDEKMGSYDVKMGFSGEASEAAKKK